MSEQKRLDRPELREAIGRIIARVCGENFDSYDEEDRDSAFYWAYEILALIPDIAREKWKSHTITLKECDRFYGERIEEAKKQENRDICQFLIKSKANLIDVKKIADGSFREGLRE